VQPRNGSAKVGIHGVPEFSNERMAFERLLNDASLNAFASPVNQPDLAEACAMGRGDVFIDDRFDIARQESVQIDGVFDRDPVRHVRNRRVERKFRAPLATFMRLATPQDTTPRRWF
jgi:hypothetical protein